MKPSPTSASVICTDPYRVRLAWRMPPIRPTGRFGTLTLMTVSSSVVVTSGSSWPAICPAVSQWQCAGSSPTSSENAIARHPFSEPVSAAPTVPECSTARPVLAPRLIPESTSSGGLPKAPRAAMVTMKPGDAATAYARTSGRPRRLRSSTTTRPCRSVAIMEAALPLASMSGAATVTSRPCWWATSASTRMPSESMPSSLVTSVRMWCFTPTALPPARRPGRRLAPFPASRV